MNLTFLTQHNRHGLIIGAGFAAFALIVIVLLVGCAAPSAPVSAATSMPAQTLLETDTLTPAAVPAATLSATPQPAPIATTAPEAEAVPASAPLPTPTPALSYTGQLVCTADNSVNIRRSADKNSEILGKLPGGATADVIAYQDKWAHISYEGMIGFVSRDYTIPRHKPKTEVPNGDWAAIIVNPAHKLPDNFDVSLADFEGGQVDKRILAICKEMFADAKKDGVTLTLVDAYRSHNRQTELYEDKVSSYLSKGYSREAAEAEAATITARPGTSEHQTGLALDIVTPSYTKRNKGFANTDAFKWLDANAQDYGFTLRYKKDKVSVTGVIYEPWHWRFVGEQAARAMKKSGQCHEEYLGLSD